MSSSVQRYIEEFRDAPEQPVYLPGDTISLRLRVAHQVNLGSVWAVFRRVGGGGAAVGVVPEQGGEKTLGGDPYITLPGKHYSLSRAGAMRASEVYFEVEVCREEHLPGEYELEGVRAYPYNLEGREELMMDFEVRGGIGFRIAEEVDVPSPRVTGWKLY